MVDGDDRSSPPPPPPPPPRRGVFSPEHFSSIARGEQLPLLGLSNSSGMNASGDLIIMSGASGDFMHASGDLVGGNGDSGCGGSGSGDRGNGSSAAGGALSGALRGGGTLGKVSKLSSVLSDVSGHSSEGGPSEGGQQVTKSILGSVSASAETILISHKRPPGAPPLHEGSANGSGMIPLEQQPDEESISGRPPKGGGGTVSQTSLNIAKACMGTGTLALPYAACQGGLLFSLIGLGLISAWNLYSVDRLLRCLDLTPHNVDDDNADDADDEEDRDEEGAAAAGQGNGNGRPQGRRGHPRRKRQHSRTSRHKRTGSSMRKLFSRLMSDRVTIGGPLTTVSSDDPAENVDAFFVDPRVVDAALVPPGGASAVPGAAAGYGSMGMTAAQAPAPSPTKSPLTPPPPPPPVGKPPPGTATYGQVAFHAFGRIGLQILDSVMTILLLGIVVAYECAIMSFMAPTPLSTGSAAGDAVLWTALVIAPLSCVPDMGYLGRFSACGVAAVLVTFVVIFWYGLAQNGLRGFGELGWDDLWPEGIEGMSRWFGVAAFGYGVVPITYNIREGMADPSKMSRATEMALLLVYLVYAIISTGVAVIYRTQTGPNGFEGDVLQELPTGWVPTAIRLAMTFVVLVTAPLLVVPCAQLVEGKLGIDRGNGSGTEAAKRQRDAGAGLGASKGGVSFFQRHTRSLSVAVRYSICLFCVAVSVLVPGFVAVLSFVGAFCVALTSFVFPPLLHLTLLRRSRMEEEYNAHISSLTKVTEMPVFKEGEATERELRRFDSPKEPVEKLAGMGEAEVVERSRRRTVIVDTVLLAWGVIATAVTSFLTFSDLFQSGEGGSSSL